MFISSGVLPLEYGQLLGLSEGTLAPYSRCVPGAPSTPRPHGPLGCARAMAAIDRGQAGVCGHVATAWLTDIEPQSFNLISRVYINMYYIISLYIHLLQCKVPSNSLFQ